VGAVKVLQAKRADFGAAYEAWLRDCRLALPSGDGGVKEIRLQKSCAPCFAKFGERKFQSVGSRVFYLPWRLAPGQTREKSAAKTNYAVKANFYSSSFSDPAAVTSSGFVPTRNMGPKNPGNTRPDPKSSKLKKRRTEASSLDSDDEDDDDEAMQTAPPEPAQDGKRVIVEKSQREKAIYTALTKYNRQLDPYAIQDIYRYSRPYIQIAGTKSAFTAITADNKVATWGSIRDDLGDKYVGFDASSIDVTEWGGYAEEDRLRFNKGDNVYINSMLLRGDYFALYRRRLEWAPLSALTEKAKSLFKPDLGGQEVWQLYSNEQAFAAVLADKRLVTWGHPYFGGDSKSVQDALSQYIKEGASIQHVYSTPRAFAALLTNGRVVTWGANIKTADRKWFEGKIVSKVCVCDDMFLATVLGSAEKKDGDFKVWAGGV
jgi:hypothetical protein